MGRPPGHIDEKKREAILEAAAQIFLEKGLQASMVEIARRARVSKQTLYNRFPSRLDIARALSVQKADALTEPLRSSGTAQEVLTALATALLTKAQGPNLGHALRGIALLSPEAPDLARTIYESGPTASVSRIASWLDQQNQLGRLNVPDPLGAAEIFAGMVLGHTHLRSVLGLDHPSTLSIEDRARETVHRFLRAYAVG